jgi:hypothetical protein
MLVQVYPTYTTDLKSLQRREGRDERFRSITLLLKGLCPPVRESFTRRAYTEGSSIPCLGGPSPIFSGAEIAHDIRLGALPEFPPGCVLCLGHTPLGSYWSHGVL